MMWQSTQGLGSKRYGVSQAILSKILQPLVRADFVFPTEFCRLIKEINLQQIDKNKSIHTSYIQYCKHKNTIGKGRNVPKSEDL